MTVEGLINGHGFKALLEPDGQKSHWLKIDEKLLEDAGADHGDPDAEAVWSAKSPLANAVATTTPTLVIHSEDDFRCPIEQAERYFMALLRAGVTTEFVRFPGEGHELSRTGKPRHRVERFDAILDWHDRHL